MNPFALVFVSIVSSLSGQSDIEQNVLETNTPQIQQSVEADLTLMTGYDRYLVEPNLMLRVQRDA